MGTSISSPGPGGNSPLVPPWADDQPQQPLPSSEPLRFKPFRTSLGKFIKSGDHSYLRSALGNYARKGTGGGMVAARRMGNITSAGASLYGALAGSGGKPGEAPPIDLEKLNGLPCEIAIETITQSLTLAGGDSDKIRIAMKDALVDALDGLNEFDIGAISDEVIVDIMISYISENIFLQIVTDSNKAWTKAESPKQREQAVNDLMEIIKDDVDSRMAPMFRGGVREFTGRQMIELQRNAIIEVWKIWEEYR